VGTARAAWKREWRDASLGLLSAQDDHMRYAAGAVLRLAVVLAVGWLAGKGFDWVTTRGDDSGGANIGAGLFAFAIGGLVILLWSFLDGRRHGWPALWTWGMMALLLGLFNGVSEFISARRLQDVPTVGQDPASFLPAPDPWSMALLGFEYPFVAAMVGAALGVAGGALLDRGQAGRGSATRSG
jgi:hypothetical protein